MWLEPASIDWCEMNYAVTSRVAEFMNTLSSLVFVVMGWYGARHAVRVPEGMKLPIQANDCIVWISLMCIGIGSSLFHARLDRWSQALDELPMLWSMLYLLHASVDFYYGVGREVKARAFVALGVAMNILYIALPQWYIVFLGMYVVILFSMIGFTHLCVTQTTQQNLSSSSPYPSPLLPLYNVARRAFLVAIVAWCADLLACAWLPSWVYGHAVWHTSVCVSVYYLIVMHRILALQRVWYYLPRALRLRVTFHAYLRLPCVELFMHPYDA